MNFIDYTQALKSKNGFHGDLLKQGIFLAEGLLQPGQLISIGSNPVLITPVPAANEVLMPFRVDCAFRSGATPYDFGTDVYIGWAGDVAYKSLVNLFIPGDLILATSESTELLASGDIIFPLTIAGQALRFGCETDASEGDGTLFYSILYRKLVIP